jgi:hypothetical protein
MAILSATLAILLLIGAIGTGIATYVAAEDFFKTLVRVHPELADAFPRPGFNTRYGPIRPSQMNYLRTKQHLRLPEPALQKSGAAVLKLLNIYAVAFTTFALSALWWSFQRGA